MATDPIADLLTRVRNAQRAGHRTVRVNCSHAVERVLEVLKIEGFIEAFQVRQASEAGSFKEMEVLLKYYGTGEPVITRIDRVSKPGRRVYSGSAKLPTVHGGLGIAVVSTSQGVVSDREARRRKVGGEILAFVS